MYAKTFRNLLLAAVVAILPLSASSALQVQEQDGVRYVSGGVGLDEREQLEALRGDFNLRLIFALASGNFVADIDVRVLDTDGRVMLETRSDGPILMANLPAGRYTVEVSGYGESQRQSVTLVTRQPTELNFYWRSSS